MQIERTDIRRDQRAMALAVLLIAIAAYANSLANGFAYDDVLIIERNTRVHRLSDQASIWLTPYWPNYGPELGLYRPLTIFGYAVQWAAGGGAPWVFHAMNVLMHAGVSVLVFLLLLHLASRPAALVGAILFAVHPVHTEVVANVVGQAELIAAGGVLAACILFVSRPDGVRVPAARLAAMALLYAMAIFAKESAIVLPGLLLALDLAQRRVMLTRDGIVRYASAMILPVVVLGAIAAVYLLLRLEVIGSITAENPGPALRFLRGEHRVLNAFRAWPEYARLLFFPARLSADYSPAAILPVTSVTPMVALGIALFAGTAVLAVSLPVYSGALAAAWFLIAVLPVSNLLFPVGILVAERTLYLPSVAAVLVAARAWDAIARSGQPRAVRLGAVAVALVTVLCSIRVISRNPDWKSTDTIMAALVRDQPESYRGQWFLATKFSTAGDTLAADDHWTFAHRLWPQDAQLLTEWGTYYTLRGRHDRAVEVLEKARELYPDAPFVLGPLAAAYLNTGRFAEAVSVVDSLLKYGGPNAWLLEMRARGLAGLGQHEAAALTLTSALRYPKGRSAERWRLLAVSLAALERWQEAEAALDSATLKAEGDTLTLKRLAETRQTLLESGRPGSP